MIVGFCAALIACSIILSNIDMFMPMTPGSALLISSLKMLGLGFGFIGLFVLVGRSVQTGAGIWFDLPSKGHINTIHSGISGKRLDPNAEFFVCRDIGLGIIKTKKKVFKDTGGGFRISGHDVRRTHEKISADIPEWLGQYLHQIKEKWKLKDDKDMISIYEQLRNIHDPAPGMSIMAQLEHIDILKPALADSKFRKEIEKMSPDDIRNMTEYLFDGETVHMEDVENFIKLASPNELDTWIKQEMSLNELEKRTYREPGPPIDWNKWLPALGMFAFIAILGTVILLSYLG